MSSSITTVSAKIRTGLPDDSKIMADFFARSGWSAPSRCISAVSAPRPQTLLLPSTNSSHHRGQKRCRRTRYARRFPTMNRSSILLTMFLAAAAAILCSSLPVSAAKEQNSNSKYAVQIPAFRLILRPIPETFNTEAARQVLDIAQGVTYDYLVEAMKKAGVVQDGTKGADHNSDIVKVESIELDYKDWFFYARRLDGDKDDNADEKEMDLELADIVNSDGRPAHQRQNRQLRGGKQRKLQGRSNYAVIESTLPIGGTATFTAPSVDYIPTQYELYMLLSDALFPDISNDVEGDSTGGLSDALAEKFGYSTALMGTFFAVDGVPSKDESGIFVVTDGPTVRPTMEPTGSPTSYEVVEGDSVGSDDQNEDDGGSNNGDDESSSNNEESSTINVGNNIEKSSTEQNNNPSSSSSALMAGSIIGALVVLLLGAFYVHRRKYRKEYDTANINGDKTRELHDLDALGGDMSGVVGGSQAGDEDSSLDTFRDDGAGGATSITTPTKKKKARPPPRIIVEGNEMSDDGSGCTAPASPFSQCTVDSPMASTLPASAQALSTSPPKEGAATACTPDTSPGSSPTSSPTPTPTDEIIDDLLRKESEQQQQSGGFQQPSSSNIQPVADLVSGSIEVKISPKAAAAGAALTAGALGTAVAQSDSPRQQQQHEEDSTSDSQAGSSSEVATISSAAALSLTPSDAEALHANRDVTMTIMKDQLVDNTAVYPFGDVDQFATHQQDAAVRHQVPVPAVNFFNVSKKEKMIHLRPNCLTADAVVNKEAGITPVEDDLAEAMSTEGEERGQDTSTSADDDFVVSSPSTDSADSTKVSTKMLEATPVTPELTLVEPKIVPSILSRIEPSKKDVAPSQTLTSDSIKAAASLPHAPLALPTPTPLIALGRVTSLDRAVNFDAPDFNPDSEWDPSDNDIESSDDSSSISSSNNPFITPENMRLNDEEFLVAPPSPFGTPESSKRKVYRMDPIDDSSFDYGEPSPAASILQSALGFGRFGRHGKQKATNNSGNRADDESVVSRDWDETVML